MVVGRFAPSPSGRMHLGNVFAAMLAWLFARSAGGELFLRLEDLDPDRCRPEYAALLKDDLRWLGLDWDREGQRQSERRAVYAEAFRELEAQGLVYPCYCTRGALHAASAPHASDGAPVYPGTCRDLTAAQRAEMKKLPAWRVRVPDQRCGFRDGLQGWQEENLARDCGDFIIRRADGVYAYQLAVVVDDGAMGVTQVVRGRDLLSSTPRQLYLYERLSLPAPEFIHVPLLLSPDGRRLSKRDRDLDLGALRQHVQPEALLGALAFTAGILEKSEPISAAELVQVFHAEKIDKTDHFFSEELLQKS
ncbi:MAG: tRNA glutamyl-Q(34) synthetase GluQRS [Oscillospiraceae bacterium]|nr:tRNA glutamyl-Q(34) synthetase GluQRS [Oscillospiraceae bacterium]